MSLVSLDYIKKVAEKHGCTFWSIRDQDGNPIDVYEPTESETVANSMALMEESYNGIQGETVLIRISPRKLGRGQDNQSKVFEYTVRCKAYAAAQVNELPGKGDAGLYAIVTQLRVELEAQKHQRTIDDLKREIDQLKKEGKSSKSSRLDKLLDVVLLEVAKANKNTTPVASVTPVAHTEEISGTSKPAPVTVPANDKERLTKALKSLQSIDADFIASLEKLERFAANNPEQYKQYLSML